MTTNDPSEIPPLIDPSDPPATPQKSIHVLRYLLAGNPFYIISAVLLLLSMRNLSLDAQLFHTEEPQLLFNFSSFHIYELMLAGTAIFLARRKIWYDSGLLVALENLFVFVPFILISQALLIKDPIAPLLCLGGCVLVVLRMASLKRWLPSHNLGKSLSWMGVALLAINVGMPILTQSFHKTSDARVWDLRGPVLQALEWFALAPLAVALANFLPDARNRTEPSNEAYFTKPYFPLATLLFWIAGSGVHFYCIDYVNNLPWQISLLVPALWMGAWTIWKLSLQSELIKPSLDALTQKILLAAPTLVLGVAIYDRHWQIVFTLTLLNAAAYLFVALKRRDQMALRFFLLSMSLAVGSLPQSVLLMLPWRVARAEIFWISLFGYSVLSSLLSRNPKAGIFGAVVTTIGLVRLSGGSPVYTNAALQLATIFLLLHSLRWDDKTAGAASARIVAAIFWLSHSIVWVCGDSRHASPGVFGGALGVLTVYYILGIVFRKWAPLIIPYAGFTVLAVPFGWMIAQFLKDAPSGLLILLGSFGLFALGTVAALTKSRWMPQEQIPSTAVDREELI